MDDRAVYFVLWGVLIATWSAANALFPVKLWRVFNSWKHQNPDTVEPSDQLVFAHRYLGLLGTLAGLGAIGYGAYLAFSSAT